MKIKHVCGDCGSNNIELIPMYEYGWETHYPDDSGYAEDYQTSEFVGYYYKCKDCDAEDKTSE